MTALEGCLNRVLPRTKNAKVANIVCNGIIHKQLLEFTRFLLKGPQPQYANRSTLRAKKFTTGSTTDVVQSGLFFFLIWRLSAVLFVFFLMTCNYHGRLYGPIM